MNSNHTFGANPPDHFNWQIDKTVEQIEEINEYAKVHNISSEAAANILYPSKQVK